MLKHLVAALVPASLLAGSPAQGQVEKLPPYLQETLARIGPIFQKDISTTIPQTVAAFQAESSAPTRGRTGSQRESLTGVQWR
jgi:hypothetical protein